MLRTDEVRKELAGLAVDQPAPAAFGAGIYTERATARTYEEVLRRAAVALGTGETVVLDASFTLATWREQARVVAAETSSDLVELRCDAPPEVAAERIRRRAAAGQDPSDATPEIAAALAAATAPWPEATTIDTAGHPAAALADALRHARVPASTQPGIYGA